MVGKILRHEEILYLALDGSVWGTMIQVNVVKNSKECRFPFLFRDEETSSRIDV